MLYRRYPGSSDSVPCEFVTHILRAACCIDGTKWAGKIGQVFRHYQGVPSSCLRKQATILIALTCWPFSGYQERQAVLGSRGRSSEDRTCAPSPAPPIDPLGGPAQISV